MEQWNYFKPQAKPFPDPQQPWLAEFRQRDPFSWWAGEKWGLNGEGSSGPTQKPLIGPPRCPAMETVGTLERALQKVSAGAARTPRSRLHNRTFRLQTETKIEKGLIMDSHHHLASCADGDVECWFSISVVLDGRLSFIPPPSHPLRICALTGVSGNLG